MATARQGACRGPAAISGRQADRQGWQADRQGRQAGGFRSLTGSIPRRWDEFVAAGDELDNCVLIWRGLLRFDGVAHCSAERAHGDSR